jgi:hypothetical protein
MLTTALLRVKNFFTKSNGDTIVDLASSTFSFDEMSGTSAGTIIVKEDEAMRPDLISVRLYNDQKHYAVLLKYNGISNPFSINPNTLLIAPPFMELEKMIVPPKKIVEKGASKPATNESKLLPAKTVKDKKRLEALKDKVKEIVPPNVNTSGNQNVKVKDGKVIFGEDVTQVAKDNCPVPISRARLIQQLTKANLF